MAHAGKLEEMVTNIYSHITNEKALQAEDKVSVEKGCRDLHLNKGMQATVKSIQLLGADYSHSVKVVLTFSGKTVVLYARHPNRLEDTIINLNDGCPEHLVKIRRGEKS